MFIATGVIGGKFADLEFQQAEATQLAAASTYTFLNANIGTARADRLVLACITSFVNVANRTITGVTIGGNAATLITSTYNEIPIKTQIATIAYLLVPSGTTATIAATFSNNMNICFCRVYTMIRYVSSTPFDTLATTAANAASVSGTIDIPKRGALLVNSIDVASTGLTTMVGANEDDDENLGNQVSCTGHEDGLSDETGRTVTVTESGAANTPEWALVAASWR